MRHDDLNDDELAKLVRRIEKLERAAPLGYSSIERGALRIVSDEGLVVGDEEQGADGGGSARVYGKLDVSGEASVTGRMHVKGGGRVISSDAGDENLSMQMFFFDGLGRVVSYGVPMEMRAWDSVIQLNENGLQIQDGSSTITMSPGSIQIVGSEGGNGSWIELKDGRVYFNNLPASDGTPIGVDAAGGLIHLRNPDPGDGGGGPSDPGSPGPASVKTFYSLDHWGDEYGATAGRPNPHRGQDINGWPTGTTVPSLTGGTVVLSEWNSALGNVVTIDRGDGLFFGYSHLDAPGLDLGSAVTAGQWVGPIGDTGTLSFGTHVHVTTSRASKRPWEGAVEDPRPYIRAAIAA